MQKVLFFLFLPLLLFGDVGHISVIKGEAYVKRDKHSLRAYRTMPLYKLDTVQTLEGRLQMHFNDKTVISLGKHSSFVIKEYLYVSNEIAQQRAHFVVQNGFVKAITGAIGKVMPEMFTLETKSAVIHPEGTIWSVDVTKDSEYYEVIDGAITLEFIGDTHENIHLAAGEALRINLQAHSDKERYVKSRAATPRIYLESMRQSIDTSDAEDAQALGNDERRVNNEMMLSTTQPEVETETPELETATPEVETETPELETATPEVETETPEVDDGNNGHGNDADGVDESNPGLAHRPNL